MRESGEGEREHRPMRRYGIAAIAGLAVGAAVGIGLRLWRPEPARAPAPAPLEERAAPQTSPPRPSGAAGADADPVPERPAFTPEGLPTTIDYPLDPKYAATPLSRVPHRLVAAWDDAPDSPDFGRRRAFIVVVDPALSDAALEDLARDARDRHRDADFLNVQIYDSVEAARTPSHLDGGRTKAEHRIAELRRNRLVPRETIRIRGRAIEP